MTVRALWVIEMSKKGGGHEVLFERFFNTVEERMKSLSADHYIPCPNGSELVQGLQHINLMDNFQTDPREILVSCSIQQEGPVHALNITNKVIWPVVVIKQNNLLFCGLSVHHEPTTTVNHHKMCTPEIASTFDLLVGMSGFVGQLPPTTTPTHPRLVEMNMFLGEVAPFGTLIDLNAYTMNTLAGSKQHKSMDSENTPSWRTAVPKSKSAIQLVVAEELHYMQFHNKSTVDKCEIHGKVICRADLEGAHPEVTVNLHPASVDGVMSASRITHPVVHTTATQPRESAGRMLSSWKLAFVPPIEQFNLCLYTAMKPMSPLTAVYSAKGDGTTVISFSMKRKGDFRGTIEYLDVIFPFTHIGAIKQIQPKPSHGEVLVASDRKSLTWNIGGKLPANSRSLDASLSCTIQFKATDARFNHNISFAQMKYKISDYSNTSLTTDVKSTQVIPKTKFKFNIGHELLARQHKVCNSLGHLHRGLTTPELPTS